MTRIQRHFYKTNSIVIYVSVIFFLGISFVPLKAQQKIILTDQDEFYQIQRNNLVLLENTQGINESLNIESLFENPSNPPLSDLRVTENFKSSYWMKFKIRNTSNKKDWVIEFPVQETDSIDFFSIDSRKYSKFSTGDQARFSQRYFQHKNFVFKIRLEDTTSQTFYARIKVNRPTEILCWVKSDEAFTGYMLNEYILLGMFYGMVVLMALFNLVLLIYLRDKSYLFYVFYVLSVGLYSLSRNGLGFQYLWPDYPSWNNNITYVFVIMAVVSQLFYTKSFLKLNSQAPLLNKFISYYLLVRIFIFVVSYFYFPSLLAFLPLDILSLILSIVAGVVVYKKGYKPARLYLLGFCFLFVGFSINSIAGVSIISPSLFTVYSIDIGASVELLFLSLAFADQIRIEKLEKEKAQQIGIQELLISEQLKRDIINSLEEKEKIKDKLKNELDKKVFERTEELNKINAILKQQTLEIDALNSKLDVENYSIKRDIKELMRSIVTLENVDFNQFKNIFPDEDSCYKFIYELKWANGYTCKKCGSHQFSNGAEPYTRRCTSCNYHESVTSHTIFHKLKFSISKAFQILFLVTDNKKITVDEIALLVEMRRNTCWNFKSKIQKNAADLEKGDTKNWAQIILIKNPTLLSHD